MAQEHQRSKLFASRLSGAIASVDRALSAAFSCARLDKDKLHSIKPDLVAGWIIEPNELRAVGGLIIGVDSLFPAVFPKLFLQSEQSWFGKLPHVNPDESVCIAPSHASIDQAHAGEAVVEIVYTAIAVILAGVKRENITDFLDEAESYWASGCCSPEVIMTCRVPGKSCQLVGAPARRGKWFVVGEDEKTVRTWLAQLTGEKWVGQCTKVAYLCLGAPLCPDCYPTSALQMCKMVAEGGFGTPEEVALTAASSNAPFYILLSSLTGNGRAVVGTSFFLKREHPGFRPGKVPASLLLKRSANSKCKRHKVFRADHEWLHWRGGATANLVHYSAERVLIAGCGALGADIAMLLAKAGVQNMTLVDSELLAWDNIGRHLLGASFVARSKVDGLKARLCQHFPHLNITTLADTLAKLCADDSPRLYEADIVVCATGDWGAESSFNLWATISGKKPVVYTWVEPHSLAGHALLFSPEGGGCLACGRNEFGEVHDRVTNWDADVMEKVPACGGWFTPYGAIDSGPVKDMAAQLVLNWLDGSSLSSEMLTYIGDERRISKLGGEIRPQWKPYIEDGGIVSRSIKRLWPSNPKCPICNFLAQR